MPDRGWAGVGGLKLSPRTRETLCQNVPVGEQEPLGGRGFTERFSAGLRGFAGKDRSRGSRSGAEPGTRCPSRCRGRCAGGTRGRADTHRPPARPAAGAPHSHPGPGLLMGDVINPERSGGGARGTPPPPGPPAPLRRPCAGGAALGRRGVSAGPGPRVGAEPPGASPGTPRCPGPGRGGARQDSRERSAPAAGSVPPGLGWRRPGVRSVGPGMRQQLLWQQLEVSVCPRGAAAPPPGLAVGDLLCTVLAAWGRGWGGEGCGFGMGCLWEMRGCCTH